MYLEISPRHTGKTFRLAESVQRFLNKDKRNIANIFYPYTWDAKHTKNIVESVVSQSDLDRVLYHNSTHKNVGTGHGFANVANFYDDFDHMQFTTHMNDYFFWGNHLETDYFVTTPSRIRDLSKISIQEAAKTDFLLKLLLTNGGVYVSAVNPNHHPSWFERFKHTWIKGRDTAQYQADIEGKFIRY